MTETEALVGINLIGGIGSIRLKKLLGYYNKPQDIIKAPPDKIARICGLTKAAAYSVSKVSSEDIKRELELVKEYNLDILTLFDENYPQNLKTIYDPPVIIYLKGSLIPQDSFSVAVIGSRRASFYGLVNAEKIAYGLADYGLTVVSGLAYGIDTRAHKGALKAEGRTIAVMGSGFNHIYPAENKELCKEIARSGAVISEFPIDTRPLKYNFPRRNRIISGLSLGVIVVEAANNSGALITADFALEQGREVFALPGEIGSINSFGTNELIKQGAKLVSQLEDVIEEFNFSKVMVNNRPAVFGDGFEPVDNQGDSERCELTSEEFSLYRNLSFEPVYLDEIVDKTGIKASQALNLLLDMEMKKLIFQLPGKQFVKIKAS